MSMIEGAGDEVVYAVACFFALFAISLIYLWKQRHNLLQQENGSVFFGFQEILRNWFDGWRSSNNRNSTTNAGGSVVSDSNGNTADMPQQQRTRTIYNVDMTCPICLNPCRYAALSNCGHAYCCTCFIEYWRHGTWLAAVACPVCRTQVTLLMPNFTESDVSADSVRTRTEALNDIRQYNRRYSNEPRSLIDYLRDIPVLVPHLMAQLFSLNGLMLMFRVRIILLLLAAGVYILSPLDVIPEAIFGLFGFFDDLFIGALLLVYLCVAYRQFLQS